MCGPEDPPFHASPAARKGPISSKRVCSQDPLSRKFGNFSLNSLNFHQILAHKPPNLEISAHKPPNLENFRLQAPRFRGKCQFASPTLRKSGPHTPTWKRVECPPPGVRVCWCQEGPLDLCLWGYHRADERQLSILSRPILYTLLWSVTKWLYEM